MITLVSFPIVKPNLAFLHTHNISPLGTCLTLQFLKTAALQWVPNSWNCKIQQKLIFSTDLTGWLFRDFACDDLLFFINNIFNAPTSLFWSGCRQLNPWELPSGHIRNCSPCPEFLLRTKLPPRLHLARYWAAVCHLLLNPVPAGHLGAPAWPREGWAPAPSGFCAVFTTEFSLSSVLMCSYLKMKSQLRVKCGNPALCLFFHYPNRRPFPVLDKSIVWGYFLCFFIFVKTLGVI